MARKGKLGRPSSFDESVAAEICERISSGQSLREITRDGHMPSKTSVFRWLADESNATFRDQYARAREQQADHFADEILEIADDASNDWMLRKVGEEDVQVIDHEHIQRSKLRVEARKWLMGKMAPKKYGDKVTNELTGADGAPLVPVLNVTIGERKS